MEGCHIICQNLNSDKEKKCIKIFLEKTVLSETAYKRPFLLTKHTIFREGLFIF
jgi:hypothetical protein